MQWSTSGNIIIGNFHAMTLEPLHVPGYIYRYSACTGICMFLIFAAIVNNSTWSIKATLT